MRSPLRRRASKFPPQIATYDPSYFSVAPTLAFTWQRGAGTGTGTMPFHTGQYAAGASANITDVIGATSGSMSIGEDRVKVHKAVNTITNYFYLTDGAVTIPAGADLCYVQRGRRVSGGHTNPGGWRSGTGTAPGTGTTFMIWDSTNGTGWMRINGGNPYHPGTGPATPLDGSFSTTVWRYRSGKGADFGVNGVWNTIASGTAVPATSVRSFGAQGAASGYAHGEWLDAWLWVGEIPSMKELDARLVYADKFAPWRGGLPRRRFISVAGAPAGSNIPASYHHLRTMSAA